MKKLLPVLFALIFLFALIGISNAQDRSELPKGVVFQVKLGPLDQAVPDVILQEFSYYKIKTDTTEKRTYLLGAFNEYAPALFQVELMRSEGFPSAHLVAFFNRRSIEVIDAVTLLDNKSKMDTEWANPCLFFRVSSDIFEPEFFYSVQLGTYKQQVDPKKEFGLDGVTVEWIQEKMIFKYTWGSYPTFAEVNQAKENLADEGLQELIEVSFLNGVRIPRERALQIESALADMVAGN